MRPFVSIIVPVRNGERHIRKCLDSLVALDYPKDSYEIIVVDNGSTDGTVDVAKGFKTVKLFIKKNVKVGAVRNYGVARSKGEVLAFIDSDCVASPGWLSNGVKSLRGDEKIGMTGSHYLPPENCSWVGKVWRARSRYNKFRGEVTYLQGGNCMISRGLFDNIGGFNEDLVSSEDVDLSHRVRIKGFKVFSDPEIAVYHHGDNVTLARFFRNEIMRGRNVVGLYLKDGRISNLKASMVAGYYLLALLLLVFSAASLPFYRRGYLFFLVGLAMNLLPAMIISFFAVVKRGIYRYYFMTVVLYLTFGLARGIAIIYPKR